MARHAGLRPRDHRNILRHPFAQQPQRVQRDQLHSFIQDDQCGDSPVQQRLHRVGEIIVAGSGVKLFRQPVLRHHGPEGPVAGVAVPVVRVAERVDSAQAPDPAVPQLEQMVQRQTHPLLVVGADRVDAVQMARAGVDADQRHRVPPAPVGLQPALRHQRNRAAELLLFEHFEVFGGNHHRHETGRSQLPVQPFQQAAEVSAETEVRHDQRDGAARVAAVSGPARAHQYPAAGVGTDPGRTRQRPRHRRDRYAALPGDLLQSRFHLNSFFHNIPVQAPFRKPDFTFFAQTNILLRTITGKKP